MCSGRGQNLENETFTDHHISSTKNHEKASLNHQGPSCEQQQKQNFREETDLISCKSNMISQTEAGLLSPVAGNLMRNSTCGNRGKENEGKENLGNGFVTTKKNRVRSNDENSLQKPQKILSECSRNKKEASSDGNDVIKRKVLSERTNLESEHFDAIGLTGKWRCPQKSKPHTGPPLKQLRLERWVHRL